MSSATVSIFRLCSRQNSIRSGTRAMLPSSFMISQMIPAGTIPANRARSTEASVCPARTRTPPFRHGQADQSAPIPGHEVDGLGSDFLRGQSQITFVFTIFVVDDNDHASR